MKIIKMDMNQVVLLYGDEFKTVFIKDIHQVSNVESYPLGSHVGFVNLVYPFGGVDCNLQLELYKQEVEWEEEYCRDEDTYDVSFKIPFGTRKTFVEELHYNKWVEEGLEKMQDMMEAEEPHEKCDCGGVILPMYEEFPTWITFCNKCDTRREDFDSCTLPY